MKIGICNDHTGVAYKNALSEYLRDKGHEIVNFGTDTEESMDYPDVANPLAEAVVRGDIDAGIAFCGTGDGMAIALNRHCGVRAGLAWNVEVGSLVKRHNNANVLVMPARFVSLDQVYAITDAWLDSSFEGGRHSRRLAKLL